MASRTTYLFGGNSESLKTFGAWRLPAPTESAAADAALGAPDEIHQVAGVFVGNLLLDLLERGVDRQTGAKQNMKRPLQSADLLGVEAGSAQPHQVDRARPYLEIGNR